MQELLTLVKRYRQKIALIFLSFSFLFLVFYPFWLVKNHGQIKGEKTISVEVNGAVNKPGLYTLNHQSRVEDALQKAGGINTQADEKFVAEVLNRARFLEDGEKIFIPFKEKTKAKAVAESNSKDKAKSNQLDTAKSATININKASQKELESLPGIGPVYAQRIVEYRQNNGPFQSKEQIKEIKGIGEKTFLKIKDLISI